jgi:hypothetical protein
MKKPSVTEVVGQVMDSRWYTPEGAKRGTDVHAACAYLDEDDLDESSVSEDIRGYVEAWKKYKSESPSEFEFIEKRFENELYTGKPDRVISESSTKYGLRVSGGVLDIKTGPINKWTGLQIAAYCELTNARVGVAVAIKKTGTYKVKVYLAQELQRNLHVFKGLLGYWHWKHE